LSVSLNNFSFDAYKQLKSDKENLFFSPLSIDIALLMAYEGARTETKSEFEKVLHIDGNFKQSEAINFISNLKKWNDSSNYMNISNAMWIKDKFKIRTDFQNTIQTKYSADIFSIDFSKREKSAFQINNWVSEKTNNLIKNIVSPGDINDQTRIVISNAVYFTGKWEDKFDVDLTNQDDFFSIEQTNVKTDFMHKTEHLDYYENADFQFISKQYIGNDKSFCVILPKNRYGISDIEAKLCKSLTDTIFNTISNVEVVVSMPKFKFERSYSLNESLMKLGLQKAFSRLADFSGITTTEPLMISTINHKAYIEINEEKTEAAAATIVMMTASAAWGPTPEPKVFKADHPFIFMILDNKTKAIIFIGRYVKPE
jgi:serpin B